MSTRWKIRPEDWEDWEDWEDAFPTPKKAAIRSIARACSCIETQISELSDHDESLLSKWRQTATRAFEGCPIDYPS